MNRFLDGIWIRNYVNQDSGFRLPDVVLTFFAVIDRNVGGDIAFGSSFYLVQLPIGEDDRLIGNKQRGTLRRAILDNTPEVPDNMTLIPTAVLDDLTKTTRELGEWIDHSDDYGYVECPICHELTTCSDNADKLHFCWNCGARMTASGNNETE